MRTRIKSAQESVKVATVRPSVHSRPQFVHPVLQLQQQLGNQAVQRLLQSGHIQAKLTIGQPNDKYEQEADRVADQVMRMPEPQVQRQPVEEEEEIQAKPNVSLLQRQPIEEEEPIQTKLLAGQITPLIQRQELDEEEEELIQTKPLNEMVQRQAEAEEEEEETLQAKAVLGYIPTVGVTTHAKIQSLKGGGQPLPSNQRSFFESRIGHSFSGVRIHTGTQAADTAQAVQAKAFTLGKDIVFNSGQYAPESREGRHLLAHELTHVVQQRSANTLIRRQVEKRSKRFLRNITVPNEGAFSIPRWQIAETEEYKSYMDSRNKWQWKYDVTLEEALLACQLIIEVLHQGRHVDWDDEATTYMQAAREKLRGKRTTKERPQTTEKEVSSESEDTPEEKAIKKEETKRPELSTNKCDEFKGFQVRIEKEMKKGDTVQGSLVGRVITKGCCNYFGARGKLGTGKKLKRGFVQFDPSVRLDIRGIVDVCSKPPDIIAEGVLSGELKVAVSLKDLILKAIAKKHGKDAAKILEASGAKYDILLSGSLIPGVKIRAIPETNSLFADGFVTFRGNVEIKLPNNYKVTASYDFFKCHFWRGFIKITKSGVKLDKSEWLWTCTETELSKPNISVKAPDVIPFNPTLPLDFLPKLPIPKLPIEKPWWQQTF